MQRLERYKSEGGGGWEEGLRFLSLHEAFARSVAETAAFISLRDSVTHFTKYPFVVARGPPVLLLFGRY